MPKFKLQIKIAILISILSFIFIYTFTNIQLHNQLEKLNSYNKFRARVGTIIVKTTLDMLLKDVHDEETLPGIFEAAIESFSKEGIVEKISVLSITGAAVATNDPIIKEFGEAKKDIGNYLELSRSASRDAWFFSSINDRAKVIDIYIPLTLEMSSRYIVKLSFSIGNIQQAMVDILVPITLTIIAVIIGNLFLGILLSSSVVRPIKVLNRATKDIASGNLDLRVKITTNDEIQELGETFNEMSIALKKMKERAENANPLTKLPGNNVIREEVEGRIRRKEAFTAVHVDLDNFKSYNDKYGIAKGDEVIKFTSEILQNAVMSKGTPGDFLGHEGGDDFFFITAIDKADAVAAEVISQFDSKIRGFYTKEDVDLGYIFEKNRRGEYEKFSIMTISLAGVSNQFRAISSYGELTNIAVGVKNKAKSEKRSVFFMDRRHENR